MYTTNIVLFKASQNRFHITPYPKFTGIVGWCYFGALNNNHPVMLFAVSNKQVDNKSLTISVVELLLTKSNPMSAKVRYVSKS